MRTRRHVYARTAGCRAVWLFERDDVWWVPVHRFELCHPRSVGAVHDTSAPEHGHSDRRARVTGRISRPI